MKRRHVLTAIPVLIAMAATVMLYAHGGGLDGYGGHNDRKRGGYHFHRGPLAGQSFASKGAALTALRNHGQPSQTETAKQQEPSSNPKTGDGTTVYVTRTGKKYHADGCQYLRSSRTPIELKEALASGYTACSRCSPPTSMGSEGTAAKPSKKSSSSGTRSPAVSQQCAATTEKGSRCKRKASAGSAYCWQHQR